MVMREMMKMPSLAITAEVPLAVPSAVAGGNVPVGTDRGAEERMSERSSPASEVIGAAEA